MSHLDVKNVAAENLVLSEHCEASPGPGGQDHQGELQQAR